jgi:hypothetical protein
MPKAPPGREKMGAMVGTDGSTTRKENFEAESNMELMVK